MIGYASSVASMGVGTLLLERAWRGKYLGEFPLFYSCIAFWLLSALALWVTFLFFPSYYPRIYWPLELTGLLVEFGILIEISDHLFRSYPVIRGLSHLSAGCVYLALFMFYVLPPVLNGEFGSDPFREFAVRVAVTQATMLLVFLAIAHYFDVSLGRNIIGLCAGFAILEAGGITIFGLPAHSNPSIRVVTGHLYPTIGLVAAIAWVHGLWRLDPSPELGSAEERNPQGLVNKLKNLNEEIVRLLK